MLGHSCGNTDAAVAAGPFWGGRTGPLDQEKIKHSLGCFVHGSMGRMRKGRGERRHFSVSDWNLWDFLQNFKMTWWYSYFTKQRFGEILVLIFHWSPMPAGIAWWEEGGAGKFTLAPLDLSAYGQSKEASRFPQLHCSGLRTLCFGAKKPESWGFVCKSKCLLSQDLVNPWGRLSAGIVSVCTARTCPRLVGE